MKTLKKFSPELLVFLISYIILYGFYLATSAGLADKTIYLQSRRYVPCALAVSVSFHMWYRAGFSLFKLWPHLLVSFFWIFTYPLGYWHTFHLNTSFIDNHFDQAFGAYIFAVTVCLRLLFFHYLDAPRARNCGGVLMALIQTLLLLVPFTEIIYYYTYNRPVSEAACVALLQTNPREAWEFIMQGFGLTGIIALVIFLLLVFLLLCAGNKLILPARREVAVIDFSVKRSLVLAVISIAACVYCVHIFPKTGVMERLVFARQYYEESAKFAIFHKENLPRLNVTCSEKTFSGPSTFIIVIGESASRDFLSAYGYQKYDSTPWLCSTASNPDFILFRHAYTSGVQTVYSLERALTEKNQYNTKEFNQSFTILDLAKKAGYTTWWFSSQGTISDADTPITLVAETADNSAWLEDTLANTKEMKYDNDLLPYLKKLNPGKNNFVIFHIMGSHDNFYNRYPPEFTKWGDPKVDIPEVGYANSLAYTDQFLQKVYDYASKNLNLQVMLYFSDHGTVPGKLRDADITAFTPARIPMFLYLSKEYQLLYPETVTNLQHNADRYYTNDLMYETVAGLLQVRSDHVVPENSLTSANYKWTKETLKTHAGKFSLSEDVNEK